MKPELTDQQLDDLLASMPQAEDVPDGLTMRIMANVPQEKTIQTLSWFDRLTHLLGTDRLWLPATSALALVLTGMAFGYSFAPETIQDQNIDQADVFLTAALESDAWLGFEEEIAE